jgi:cytochrome c-type biogenesis protein
MNVTVWLAFVAGLLSFVSPCVLPLIPAYVGYMSNRVTAQAITAASRDNASVSSTMRFQMALHGLAFIAGFMFVFVVFGLIIAASTRLVSSLFYDVQRDIIPRLGGLLIILFGLHFIGVIVPVLHWLETRRLWDHLGKGGLGLKHSLGWLQSVLYADTRLQINRKQHYGLVGSSLMGVVFAAGWTPCIGPIYGSILTMAVNSSESIPQASGCLPCILWG